MDTKSGTTIWLPEATSAVNRWFWQRKQRQGSGWFVFGGCLFWAVLIYVYLLFVAVKAVVWAVVVLVVLPVGQVLTLTGQALGWAVVHVPLPGSHRSG